MAEEPEGNVRLIPLPVEDKPAEESDALERSLLPAVDSEEAQTLARLIHRQHHEALDDRAEWESRLAEWEDQYYGRVDPKDFPWPGAANFHVPLTMMGVETYKPRLVEAVLGNDPPIQVVPVESTDETRRDRTELFLNWQVRTEMDVAETVAESAHLYLQPGTVVAKVTWDVERRRRRFVREFPQGTPLEQVLQDVFAGKALSDIENVGNLKWRGAITTSPRTGGDAEVELQLKFLEDGGIQAKVTHEDVRERPRVDLIDPPDFIAPARGGSDLQRLPWCQQRLWMTEDDLRAKVLQGRFDHDAVEKLLEHAKLPAGDRSQVDATAYREAKSSTEGVEDQGPSNVRKTQYEVLEDHRFYDVDEEGREDALVTWYCKDLPEQPLGWDLLDNVYAHGRRPFVCGRFFPTPFRFYGLSFAEVIRGIQDEADTIHNQRVDFGTVQNLPIFFYRASSTIPAISMRLKPGEGIPLDNPQQDVNFPKWGGSPAFGQAEEALLLQYYERLTGLSDLTLGRQPNRVGATRTAAGTSTLLQESGLRQKTAIEAFQRFWTEIFEQVLALDQEYLPAGKEFRVTGRTPEYIRLKDRGEIRGRYDLRLTATTQTMNRVVAREDATIVLQALLNPALIQVGLVGLKGIQRTLADFLRAYGKDPDSYLEVHAVPHSPEEELGMIVSGQQVRAVMGPALAEHLAAHQLQLQNPVIRSVLRTEGLQALRALLQEEAQLAQAQQLAQALQQQQGGRPRPQGPQAAQAQQGAMAPQPQQPGPGANLAMGGGLPGAGNQPGA